MNLGKDVGVNLETVALVNVGPERGIGSIGDRHIAVNAAGRRAEDDDVIPCDGDVSEPPVRAVRSSVALVSLLPVATAHPTRLIPLAAPVVKPSPLATADWFVAASSCMKCIQ